MTLTELQECVNRMVDRVNRAGMNPDNMEVKIWGDNGLPRRIEAQEIVDTETVRFAQAVD